MATGSFVVYLRVSTQEQGRSGLGIEAQREAVQRYLNGGDWQVVAEFVEVESGKRNDRPQLAKALATCRRMKATLIIAKLDRLARNVAFIANLMDAGVDFIAVDNPTATRFTLHILAAVAEHEAAMISTRTKAALAAAKSRGVLLGKPENLTATAREHGQVLGRGSQRSAADAFAADLQPVIDEIRAGGVSSLSGIARELNRMEVPTARSGAWTSVHVSRLISRLHPVANFTGA
ncbi:MAG: recombinase family protein [Rhodospirillaceae bacterium]